MRQLLFFTFFILMASSVRAQNGSIRGSIIEDASGETVIGAYVSVVGTGKGAVTDLDGEFTFSIAPGTYTVNIAYAGYRDLTVEEVVVTAGQVTLIKELRLMDSSLEFEQVVVSAKAVRSTETALMTLKRKAPAMLDGISSARMQLTGGATALEAAKRVTGLFIEDGKYVYVRGLSYRYSKSTLNNMDIPGLDPDRNTLQMDIFPTNMIDNIVVSKNFTADMPADFAGGLLNIETKDFPEERIFKVSVSTGFNPDMHLNPDFLAYNRSGTDFLGFDDGTRALPERAAQASVPTPYNGASEEEVVDFVTSFNPELATQRKTSLLDYRASLSLGNQFNLGKKEDGNKLGYIFSLSYKTDYRYYDDVNYGEYLRWPLPDRLDLLYATVHNGQLGEQRVLASALGGLAYKTKKSKYRLTAMHVQSGESRAGQYFIQRNGTAVSQGYEADADNLEYEQRGLTNILLNGRHLIGDRGWAVDWRLSPTLSTAEDPDIRKTAFTYRTSDTIFNAGAGGNPTRIWRYLDEFNAVAKLDFSKKYQFKGADAKLRFGASHLYKEREYEILSFDLQFTGTQSWPNPDPAVVLNPENIFPNLPNGLYYQSGNNNPNPNAYESNASNTAFYVSNEFVPLPKLKTILGVRTENFVQRHTGRDQAFASGDIENGNNLDNEKVLDALDFFPSVNLIYELSLQQNLRGSYTRSIARPSFKELSFAQILDPITNRIFNGSLFTYADWDGRLTETRIDNFDLRWELFQERGQLLSASLFYKRFDNPIELVRIPEQYTNTEFQQRNVGDGQLYGVELEFRKSLEIILEALRNFHLSGNITFVQSEIDMTAEEFQARKEYEKTGENITNTRRMAGQAPYVLNLGASYSNIESGWESGLFYNVKGETLELVGVGLYPDVFFQPFHSLNFSLSKRIGKNKNTLIDFKVANILNDRIESFYKSFGAAPEIFNSINPGRAFSIGLSHGF